MEVDITRFVFAIMSMIVMFIVFAWGLKHWAGKRGITPKAGKRRLKLNETLYIDARTRVCLIQQDDDLLTVMVGQNSQTLLNKKKIEEKNTPSHDD